MFCHFSRDVGKVTNWFRNLRQTARKRAKRTGVDEDGEHDDDSLHSHQPDFQSASRPGTPSQQSSASSPHDRMDVDEEHDDSHSDAGSEEDSQEAVTPSPEASPSPAPPAITAVSSKSHHQSHRSHDVMDMVVDPVSYGPLQKIAPSPCTGVKVEDALLLLSFHKHTVS